jgi:hypothetical protein
MALINSSIDSLITQLCDSHIYYLNDNMVIIKLYKNLKFMEWLRTKNIIPTYKSYHATNNKVYKNIAYRDNNELPCNFITICMIQGNKNADYKYNCCITNNKKNKDYFNDINSSGFSINGSFFLLDFHVRKQMYNITNSSLTNFPIGYYRNNYDTSMNVVPSVERGIYAPLEPGMINLDRRTFSQPVKHSLRWIEEYFGVLTIVDNTKSAGNKQQTSLIQSLVEFENEKINYNAPDDKTQYLLGNLLIKNGEILFNENIATMVINIKEINNGTKTLPLFTKCYPYILNAMSGVKKYMKIVPNTINTYLDPSNNYMLHIKPISVTTDNPEDYFQTQCNLENIFCPFTPVLYKGGGGLIPPAMPSHAFDLNPRSCAFIDENNNVFFMQVEGRQYSYGGCGLDLYQLAQMCKEMGAVHAINLDGGGSSILTWKEKGMNVCSSTNYMNNTINHNNAHNTTYKVPSSYTPSEYEKDNYTIANTIVVTPIN